VAAGVLAADDAKGKLYVAVALPSGVGILELGE
jgi:hypothetical protein